MYRIKLNTDFYLDTQSVTVNKQIVTIVILLF